ncbi:type VII secretion system-associated protein [Streptomyces sp. NPDC002587]
MATANQNLTHLDGEHLRLFITNDLEPFLKELTAIAAPPTPPDDWYSMGQLALSLDMESKEAKPDAQLKIGPMGRSAISTSGKEMITNTQKAAAAIAKVLSDQKTLFGDIDTDLKQTIEKYLKTQGDSLDSIASSDFITEMDLVDRDLTPPKAPPAPPPTTTT